MSFLFGRSIPETRVNEGVRLLLELREGADEDYRRIVAETLDRLQQTHLRYQGLSHIAVVSITDGAVLDPKLSKEERKKKVRAAAESVRGLLGMLEDQRREEAKKREEAAKAEPKVTDRVLDPSEKPDSADEDTVEMPVGMRAEEP